MIAAKEMQSGGPEELSYTFHKDDLVLLEATNLQTTHPKAKLAPRRYGPFKVIWASPTNCKLQLPETMRVHPVFHNSLLKPYHETQAHGPNFKRPPPEIIGGEEGHYKINKVLAARPTRNRKSTQYFVHWKGYTDCYDPEPLPQFSTIFHHFISRSQSLVSHSFPYAPLGPSPNHLTCHLMDHMTNPQSTITCHHSAVRSIMTCPHLTPFDLPAHDGLFLDCQLMMELYLEPPRHDFTLVIFPYFFVTSVTRYFSNVYKRSYF